MQNNKTIDISQYDYELAEERIAKFPLPKRDSSKLLIWKNGAINHAQFSDIPDFLPTGSLLAFNNTKVVRARIIFHKKSGARIEIFCLEPHAPADYERAFSVTGRSSWHCIIGNAKKWKDDPLTINYENGKLTSARGEGDTINFEWDSDDTFGQLLEKLGKVPIPPYLGRESEDIDTLRYQTVYSKYEGSVAAPTAGLHFSPELLENLSQKGFPKAEITLHVGAGTFLPIKEQDASQHRMHTEFFVVSAKELEKLAAREGKIIAVGTTTVRTLESLAALGERIHRSGNPEPEKCVGQWELYNSSAPEIEKPLQILFGWMQKTGQERLCCSTQIMITPGYRFRTIQGIVTNFHQPKSTLLLLIAALTGEKWRDIYDHAMWNDFRFLSYGDSSLLLK